MNKKDLYRPNVAMIIVSNEYPKKKEIFVARRDDMRNIWQFPQGGIDKGEEVIDALFREMKEEIGTKKAKIIAEYPEWISYDFPDSSSKKMKPYKGQTQRYFLVKLKKKAKINLATKHPEFDEFKFVDVDNVLDGMRHFKTPIYKTVIKHFKEEGLL